MHSSSPAANSPSDSDDLLQEYLELWADKGIDAVRGAAAENGPLSKRLEVLQDLEDLAAALDPGDRSILDPPEELKLDHLDRFEALELIGVGGLARVYRAYDPELSRQVALKVFDSSRWVTESSLNWILNEGRTIARLDHPGVVRVYEVGEHDGLAFMAMELIEGPSLQDLLDFFRGTTEGEASEELQVAAGRLTSIRARCSLLRAIADTLAYGHSQGIVHRDVKPANVLLAKDGTPKLIDFGLAHLPESGSLTDVTERLVGTPAYVAPEQVDSGQTGADPKSDQFSLGVLMYELLTLENPFERGTRAETMAAVSRAAPPRPRSLNRQIPAALETVCLHALEAQPSRRYADVGALVEDLDAFLENRAISLGSSGATAARLWLRRNRTQVLRAGALALLLAGTFTVRGAWESYRAVQAEKEMIAGLTTSPSKLTDVEQLTAEFEILEGTFDLVEREAGSLTVGSMVRDLRRAANERLGLLSTMLKRAIEDDYFFAEDRLEKGDLLRMCQTVFRKWEPLLALEEDLYRRGLGPHEEPPGLPTDVHRARGTFVPPPAPPGQRIEIRALENPPEAAYSMASLLPWPQDDLPEGLYRISAVDDATGRVQSEVEVLITFGAPIQHVLEMHPSKDLRFEIEPQNTECTFEDRDFEEVTTQVAPFQLTRLVTWRDLLTVFPEESVNRLRGSADWSDPATPSVAQAHAYARAMGARLPMMLELRVADDEELLTLEGTELTAEYVSEPGVTGPLESTAYRAHSTKPLPEGMPPSTNITLSWLANHPAFGIHRKTGFRLARTIRYDD